ncbi:hypothetical protein IscW_ISCW022905 [Ixodes scapularis]|uniref:Uncharacterized protein n=1 Tax=Ixodes scapularis TaxID=6945 RepID=B7QBQ8_IXOSC|nr:hypothetical protein IscW_ISCW022905 [Ixodes scapularis]|eukprot:XP_002412972.1 hypothetical protein IscW_ISCW022905 [Ixodes scapularis]
MSGMWFIVSVPKEDSQDKGESFLALLPALLQVHWAPGSRPVSNISVELGYAERTKRRNGGGKKYAN